jgi:hypothetical protein
MSSVCLALNGAYFMAFIEVWEYDFPAGFGPKPDCLPVSTENYD